MIKKITGETWSSNAGEQDSPQQIALNNNAPEVRPIISQSPLTYCHGDVLFKLFCPCL